MTSFKTAVCCVALLWGSLASAQYRVTISDTDNPYNLAISPKRNVIKTNATAIFSGSLTLSYERDVLDWLSLEGTIGRTLYYYRLRGEFLSEIFEIPFANDPDMHGSFFEFSAVLRMDEDYLGDYSGLGLSLSHHFWPYDSQSTQKRLRSTAIGIYFRYQDEIVDNFVFNLDVGAFSHFFILDDENMGFSLIPRFRISLGYMF
jgi:hypothetical protein